MPETAPMPSSLPPSTTVVAYDKRHLQQLIREAMRAHGPQCSLNHIDVRGIHDMSRLFCEHPFNGDISKWDVSNVMNMAEMFAFSTFNGDVAQWNTARVTSMTGMFSYSDFNADVSCWDVQRVFSFYHMFAHSHFNGSVANWQFSACRNVADMFKACPFRGDLSKWTIEDGTAMRGMLDTNTLLDFASPCFYHWRCAQDNPGVLANRPQWHAHWCAMSSVAQLMNIQPGVPMALFVQEAWCKSANPAQALSDMLELPDLSS